MAKTLPEKGLILPKLRTKVLAREVVLLPVTPSTNALALACPGDGAVFVAEEQTAGRGRHGNQWHSAPGLGLWFSIALRGSSEGLMFAGALAVRDAAAPRATLRVKWPNDLLCRGRKVCGILVESRQGRTALGIGVNVAHQAEDFPVSLRATAGSLEQCAGGTWDRGALLGRILEALDGYILRLRRGDATAIRSAWAEACGIVGRRIAAPVCGRVAAVDENGALLVRVSAGLRHVTGADVVFAEEDGILPEGKE